MLGKSSEAFSTKTPPQISPSNFTTRFWVVAGPKIGAQCAFNRARTRRHLLQFRGGRDLPQWPSKRDCSIGAFELRKFPQLYIVKVARLQSEFFTKDFFRATNFLTKNAPKCPLKFLSLYFVGQKKNPGKVPPNFPLNFPNFPARNQKKFTDELLQERRENTLKTAAKHTADWLATA